MSPNTTDLFLLRARARVRNATEADRQQRQNEYLECLRQNLRNPYVRQVHLLLQKEEEWAFLSEQGLRDPCGKIVTHLIGKRMLYRDAFQVASADLLRCCPLGHVVPRGIPWRAHGLAVQYANERLANKFVVVMNSDVFLGHGWENLAQRVMVPLLRSSRAYCDSHHRVANDNQEKIPERMEDVADETLQKQNDKRMKSFMKKKLYALSRYELSSAFCPNKTTKNCKAPASLGT